MTPKEILEQIEIILPKLQQYITYKETTLDDSERTILTAVGKAIVPDRSYSLACGSCGVELIQIVWAYYQREKNKKETATD